MTLGGPPHFFGFDPARLVNLDPAEVMRIPRPVNNAVPYLVAIVIVVVIGVGGTLAVLMMRPLEDNASLYVAIAGFCAPTIASLAAFIKNQETHLLVNSRMDEFRKTLSYNAAIAEQLARKEGVREGMAMRLLAQERATEIGKGKL